MIYSSFWWSDRHRIIYIYIQYNDSYLHICQFIAWGKLPIYFPRWKSIEDLVEGPGRFCWSRKAGLECEGQGWVGRQVRKQLLVSDAQTAAQDRSVQQELGDTSTYASMLCSIAHQSSTEWNDPAMRSRWYDCNIPSTFTIQNSYIKHYIKKKHIHHIYGPFISTYFWYANGHVLTLHRSPNFFLGVRSMWTSCAAASRWLATCVCAMRRRHRCASYVTDVLIMTPFPNGP